MSRYKFYLEEENSNNEIIKEYEILKKFKAYNILKERIELYKDFSILLLKYIYDTYLGRDYIKTKKDIEGHFNWCYGKALNDFDSMDVDFYGNDDLYNYFLDFYIHNFYSFNNQKPLNFYKKIWERVFNYKKQSKKDIEILLELYNYFDESLELKINEKINS